MGRVNTSRRLADLLADRGHTVTVASPADIAHRVGEFSGDFVSLPAPAIASKTTSGEPVGARIRRQLAWPLRWRNVDRRRRSRLDRLGLSSWRELLDDRNPDLIVADLELPAHVMGAIGAGRRVVLWTTMLSVWRRPGLPPLHSSIEPGEGFAGSPLGITLAWWRFLAWKRLRALRLWFTRAGEDQRSMMRLIARSVGFDWNRVDEREWLLPCTFRDIPTLEFNAIEMEFPHTPHPWVHYVGPLLDSPPPSEESDPPTIYAGFGAWHKGDDRAVIEAVIEAAARHPEWNMVIGLGGRGVAEGLPTSSNVDILPWAPQPELLAKASVAIHHAGINTINECIAAQTPMVAIPFGYGDTPGAAARVRHHGLGIVLERGQVDADRIELAITALLTDGSYRRRLGEMRRALNRYDGRAVELIEAHLT